MKSPNSLANEKLLQNLPHNLDNDYPLNINPFLWVPRDKGWIYLKMKQLSFSSFISDNFQQFPVPELRGWGWQAIASSVLPHEVTRGSSRRISIKTSTRFVNNCSSFESFLKSNTCCVKICSYDYNNYWIKNIFSIHNFWLTICSCACTSKYIYPVLMIWKSMKYFPFIFQPPSHIILVSNIFVNIQAVWLTRNGQVILTFLSQ